MNNVTTENSTHRLYSNMATRLLSAEEVADGYDTFPSGSSGGEVGLPSLNGHLNYNASNLLLITLSSFIGNCIFSLSCRW